MIRTSSRLAAVHLLRQCNGIDWFRRFVDSYRMMAEPLEHDLVIIFKGFDGHDKSPYLKVLEDIAFQGFDVPDSGFDIGPYLEVSRHSQHERLCFLNSFSTLLAPAWLTKLDQALSNMPKAGVVGATGSYEPAGPAAPFPNYHLRTNGFLISRELLLDLEVWEMKVKPDVSRFEAGPKGMTRQVLQRGLEPYVVDRDGTAWARADWEASGTYRSGEQERLLIADNRTNAYLKADPETRGWLRRLAWSPGDPGRNPQRKPNAFRRLQRWLSG
ncbi:MAG: hypothetical protein JSU82_09865 [Rhodospirillales bacterium]|nr:MAG: hypothetical protein JSU82_09865 [Rhodospirillales bacterium]